jgi:hypothetical protein
VADHRFDIGLAGLELRHLAGRQQMRAQPAIDLRKPRRSGTDSLDRLANQPQPQDIGLQGIGGELRRHLGTGGIARQPEIMRRIVLSRRKGRQRLRHRQRFAIEGRLFLALLGMAEPAQEGAAVGLRLGEGRLDLDAARAPQRPEHHAHAHLHVVEAHRRLGVVHIGAERRHEAVPQGADGLLGLPGPEVQPVVHGDYPMVAATTSRSARFTSSSSVSGSIMASPMARSIPMPSWIRVAA